MKKSIKVAVAVIAPLAVLGTCAAVMQAANASPVALQPRVTLAGTVLPKLAQSTRTGDVPADKQLSVAVSLKPSNSQQLDQFISQVSNPQSPTYGKYLTPEEFTAKYGAPQDQIDKMTAYLKSKGLNVDSVAANHLIVDASGPASAMEQTFGTKLSTRRDASGQDYYANDSALTLPRDLAPAVSDVAGLDNHRKLTHPPLKQRAVRGLTPANLTGAYDVKALNATGAGQQVAVFELDAFQQQNINAYDQQFGLKPPTPIVKKVDGGVALGEGQTEVELDIEAISAIAPQAQQTVFEGPNSNKGVIDTYAAIVNSKIPVVSISWGGPEEAGSQADIQAQDTLYKQAAAQGQSLFAASGDSGSDDAGNGGQSVDFPASDPFVTGTGGTHLVVSAANGRTSESGWVDSGGGNSKLFAAPDYQANLGSKVRMVPDIAADADPATGLAVFSKGQFGVVGGTSAAAPQWAGFTALYNQLAKAAGKPALGFANPALYKLSGTAALHDIVGGSNGAFTATKGYDRVTGLGSFDAAQFVKTMLGQ
ncbi:protease pro-enzyme activation domain-containing protein [Kutzneria buriramensis]|uniref:S53 family peptidase n=1 Tax=Kutzneria buriramensis TaxID=1045776 RepID=UPI001B861BD0|nr:S53 family peptidase [Kutzneria buriramensis]